MLSRHAKSAGPTGWRRVVRVAAVTLVLGLLAAACGGAEEPAATPEAPSEPEDTEALDTETPATTDEAITIGVWGPVEFLEGEGIAQGAQLAAAEINAAGGIDGREVVILSEDSEGNPEGATAAVRRLIDREVDALVGGFLTGEVLATVDLVADAQIPFLNPGASGLSIQAHLEEDYDRYKYLFRVGTNVASIARHSCDVIGEIGPQLDVSHVGIIYDDRQWTEELRPVLIDCLENELGLEVSTSGYDHTSTDFSPNFLALINEGADWLVQLNSTADAILVGQQWGELEVQAPLSGFNGQAQVEGFYAATGGAAAYMGPFWQAAVPNVEITSRTIPFFEAYVAEFGEEPIYNAIAAYESIYVLKDAIERSGVTGGDDLIDALLATDMEGVYGHITFAGLHERHHENADPVLGVQILPDGERSVIFGPAGADTQEFVVPPWINN